MPSYHEQVKNMNVGFERRVETLEAQLGAFSGALANIETLVNTQKDSQAAT